MSNYRRDRARAKRADRILSKLVLLAFHAKQNPHDKGVGPQVGPLRRRLNRIKNV
jgi:hypothetical protein